MGSRDFRKRETKKPKKDAKKVTVADILSPSETVEVIKKPRRKQEEEE